MKTFNLLILGILLLLTESLSAQRLITSPTSSSIRKIKPAFVKKTNPNNCNSFLPVSLKGTVKNPNHTLSKRAYSTLKNGKFYIKALKPIREQDYQWAQFPFSPGFPSGKITSVKISYSVQPSPNNSKRTAYISQTRMVQGPSVGKGTVRIDDGSNLFGSSSHVASASGAGFSCGNDIKTVSLKLVMQPGDVIRIDRIVVEFECPQTTPSIMCPVALPNPKIKLAGAEPSGNFTRYRIPVYNAAVFPDYLFSAAPFLPACGANTNASRTWVDIFDQNNKRIYGFCALGKASDLKNIWFAVKKGEKPPYRVKIIMTDRACSKKYSSNWISIPQS